MPIRHRIVSKERGSNGPVPVLVVERIWLGMEVGNRYKVFAESHSGMRITDISMSQSEALACAERLVELVKGDAEDRTFEI